jgi:hypothetical protein
VVSAAVYGTVCLPVETGGCQKKLGKCLPCCDPTYATLNVALGWQDAYGGHPFAVERFRAAAKEGLIEADDVTAFRRVLHALTLSRVSDDLRRDAVRAAGGGGAVPATAFGGMPFVTAPGPGGTFVAIPLVPVIVAPPPGMVVIASGGAGDAGMVVSGAQVAPAMTGAAKEL